MDSLTYSTVCDKSHVYEYLIINVNDGWTPFGSSADPWLRRALGTADVACHASIFVPLNNRCPMFSNPDILRDSDAFEQLLMSFPKSLKTFGGLLHWTRLARKCNVTDASVM